MRKLRSRRTEEQVEETRRKDRERKQAVRMLKRQQQITDDSNNIPTVLHEDPQPVIPLPVPEQRPQRSPRLSPTSRLAAMAEKLQGSNSGLEVRTTTDKGRGVFTTAEFHTGDLLLEYKGELITGAEASRREEELTTDGCYLFFFSFKGASYCLDATVEDGTLARLVNHGRRIYANCHPKIIDMNGTPRIYFQATRDLTPGDELLYDYGERRKDIIKANPWLGFNT